MAYVVIPSKRLRPPRRAVGIRNEYRQSLIAFLAPFEVIGAPLPVLLTYGTATRVAVGGNPGWQFSEDSANRIYNDDSTVDKGAGFPTTFVGRVTPTATTATGFHMIGVNGNASNHRTRVYLNETNSVVTADAAGATTAGTSNSANNAWAFGTELSVGGIFLTATSRTGYANGVASTTNTSNIGTVNALTKLSYGVSVLASTTNPANITLHYGAWWLRAFDAAEMKEIHKYPYMWIAEYRHPAYFFGVGAGGTAYTIDAQPGSYSVTGAAATLLRDTPLNAQPGSYSVTGAAATLLRDTPLDAQPGSYAVTGVDATLTYTPAGAVAYELDAQPGAFTIDGPALTMNVALSLGASPGSFVVDGAAATLSHDTPGGFRATGGWSSAGIFDLLEEREKSRRKAREQQDLPAPVEKAVERVAERAANEGLTAEQASAVLRQLIAAEQRAQAQAKADALAKRERQRLFAEQQKRAQALLAEYRRIEAAMEAERQRIEMERAEQEAARQKRNRIIAALLLAAS